MRRAFVAVVAFVLAVSFPASALAAAVQEVSPAVLASADAEFDGATVSFSGEVISESLRADADHVWLNILSDGVAIGVYMPNEMAEPVTTFGDYGHTGDIVEVVGVFSEACDQHGGDMDIHAVSLDLLEPGTETEHKVQWWKGIIGAIGLLIAAVQTRRFRRMRDEVSS